MSKLSYGIGISNAFDLLQDENEEIEAAKNQRPGMRTQVAQKKAPTETRKSEGRTEGGQGRGGSQRGRGESRGRGRRFVGGEGGATEGEFERSTERHHDRGDRRGREGLPVRPGKRVYDRRSGTGRGKEVSKGGAGRGNWGSNTDAIAEGEETVQDETVQPEVAVKEEKPEETKEETVEETEVEPPTRSLAEYLEETKSKALGISLPPPRRPGEGEDPSKWKDYVPLKKDVVPVEGKKEKKEKKKKEEKAEPELNKADLLGFKPPERRTEGRGGRRGDRGGRGRGSGQRGQRGGRGGHGGESPKLLVQDTKEFPSLAAKP